MTDLPLHNPWFDIFWGYILFCVIVSGLPEPNGTAGFFYKWLWNSSRAAAIIPVTILKRKASDDK